MKKGVSLILTALMLTVLPSCGCGGKNADLVFVNDSDTAIAAVVTYFEDQTSGAQNANSSPLKRGETFGFEAGEYPVTVVVYKDVELRQELGRVTVRQAPPDEGRWYVTARGSGNGLSFTVDTEMPKGA